MERAVTAALVPVLAAAATAHADADQKHVHNVQPATVVMTLVTAIVTATKAAAPNPL